MKPFVVIGADNQVRVYVQTELAGIIECYERHVVGPGEDYFGLSYEELLAGGSGSIAIPDDEDTSEQ